MSIYATHLSIDDDDDHGPGKCPRWVKLNRKEAETEIGSPARRRIALGTDERAWAWADDSTCDCRSKAPYVYAGSHVNPSPDDPKGGYLLACAIPDWCHPDVRGHPGSAGDDGAPVNYLRLSMGEDPATYHGMEPGQATLVLDRRQVKRLTKTLNGWLKTHPKDTE